MARKILVIGGTGLVGNALVRGWRRRGEEVAAATYHCHPSAQFLQLDMQDEAAVRRLLKDFTPHWVAVPAANPFVDYCELHPEETRRVNVDGTLNVARACAAIGARMIFYSSDYVFDGSQSSYGEGDPVSPINEYGRQKAEAEKGVLAAGPGNLVIRTSGAYGWQWEPKNFVLQIRAKLGAGERMKVAADLRYNPTYVENLADVTADLVAGEHAGIFHAVGADRIGRCDFAREVSRVFRLDESLLVPVASRDFSSPTPRPKQTSLRTEKLKAAASIEPWGVRRGLEHMAAAEAEWRRYAEALPRPPAPAR